MKQTSFLPAHAMVTKAEHSQFFTPIWLAEALVERHFPNLGAGELVLEPSCGVGAFLQAIPRGVPAVGVELDPEAAQRARDNTGREVIVGDFRTVDLPDGITTLIGNPPFVSKLFEGFMDRAHQVLPEGARAGFILPTYFFQVAASVNRFSERWGISVEMMPRNCFNERMQTPLLFALFEKGAARRLFGLAIYHECGDLHQMAEPYRSVLEGHEGSVWLKVCEIALRRLGGRAKLAAIYNELEGNCPPRTEWWREGIRRTLRAYNNVFRPLGAGEYELRAA